MDASAARDFIERLLKDAEVAEDPPHPERAVAADPADDYLIARARAAGASVIVTGDRHLLEIEGLRPPAIRLREFLAILRLHLG